MSFFLASVSAELSALMFRQTHVADFYRSCLPVNKVELEWDVVRLYVTRKCGTAG